MKVEALSPLKLKLSGNDVREVQAGEVIDMPSDVVLKLATRAPGQAWVLPANDNWLSRWLALATGTLGIRRDDPRYVLIMELVEELDRHFKRDDRKAFHQCS